MIKQGGKCHWCGVPITRVISLPASKRLRVSKSHIHLHDGTVLLVATIDHLDRLRDKGRVQHVISACDRLVMSCYSCNLIRTKHPSGFEGFLKKRIKAVAENPGKLGLVLNPSGSVLSGGG